MAWLAGMIDGEGCISATYIGGPRDGQRQPICTQLSIASADWRVIERIKKLINLATGMHVACYNAGSKLNLDCWTIRLSRKRLLRALLPRVLRYLVLKKAQAALAFAMVSREWDNNGAPSWVGDYGHRIRWFNRHRIGPDGQWYTTGSERTRQSRGKRLARQEAEPVETLQAAEPCSEEKVHVE